MKKKHITTNFVFVILLAIALMYSYEGLQYLEILVLNQTLFAAFPTTSSYLQDNYYQLDCLLMLPMLIIYGILVNKLVLTSEEASLIEQNQRQFKIIGLRKYCVPSKIEILACFIIGCGLNGISSLWFVFADKFLMQYSFWNSSMDSFADAFPEMTLNNAVFDILSVVILGPIVEELLFRGLIFNSLKRFNNGLFPVLFSGILFGIFHVEPVQVVYTTIIGIILGAFYFATKRLDIVILLHIFNNLISTILPEIDNQAFNDISSIVLVLMIIPTFIVLFVYIQRHRRV